MPDLGVIITIPDIGKRGARLDGRFHADLRDIGRPLAQALSNDLISQCAGSAFRAYPVHV
jgi:hypothetical protein